MEKYLIIISIVIIIISCSTQKDDNPKVVVDMVDSLSFDCAFPLLTWYDNGVYYNSDISDNKIRIYENGENIDSFGGSGQGPGQFSDIAILALTKEKLVAVTMMPDRITKISESEFPEYIRCFMFSDHAVISQQLVRCENKSLYFSKLDRKIGLEDITSKVITSEFKEFIKDCDIYDPKDKLPGKFPIFKQIFELDQRIFVQTQYQYYSAKMNNTNTVYELDLHSGKLTEVVFPRELDMSKLFITNNKRFIILDSDNEKIVEYVVKYL